MIINGDYINEKYVARVKSIDKRISITEDTYIPAIEITFMNDLERSTYDLDSVKARKCIIREFEYRNPRNKDYTIFWKKNAISNDDR